MKVHWQEAAMAAAIVWVFSTIAQIDAGFFQAVLRGLPWGVLAGAAYGLLMPWVICWAAGKNRQDPPET
ncbi:hypothetical protein [Meiothermus rufus]|uniref:hypothetical protein n=1 Tax=Meiothermus rufus TaxID=604332 RepID=UPI0004245B91|nr:hypothetical protein [Meiothermus rufus]